MTMWPIEHVEHHDLGTPEGLAWWSGLSEVERERWRERVRNDPPRDKNGDIFIGGLSPLNECE
jgi:hypothetical protein